jgi:hypothetical protein
MSATVSVGTRSVMSVEPARIRKAGRRAGMGLVGVVGASQGDAGAILGATEGHHVPAADS